ncbi:MAG: dTMP kinase [Aquisalimonadaceae bacterium]
MIVKGDTGKFITLEGVEGAGKTTALATVEQCLQAHVPQLTVTREPGGTPLGEAIRALLLGHAHTGMTGTAETLLVFAARAEHLQKVIRPRLAEGSWVLCDRFTDATYAYQGGGRELGADRIAELETWVQGGVHPDLTLILDLPVEQGLARAATRGDPDRFESEARPFFNRVREAYLARAAIAPERYRVIDASRPLDEVQTTIREVLEQWLRAL